MLTTLSTAAPASTQRPSTTITTRCLGRGDKRSRDRWRCWSVQLLRQCSVPAQPIQSSCPIVSVLERFLAPIETGAKRCDLLSQGVLPLLVCEESQVQIVLHPIKGAKGFGVVGTASQHPQLGGGVLE